MAVALCPAKVAVSCLSSFDAVAAFPCAMWNRLRCHSCTEPYILAARRQLSTIHPVMKALQPHFKDTMQADAFARMSLFNAGGTIESVYNAGPYCMRFSSVVYGRFWRFDQQGLPGDLIFRQINNRWGFSGCTQ